MHLDMLMKRSPNEGTVWLPSRDQVNSSESAVHGIREGWYDQLGQMDINHSFAVNSGYL